MDIPPTNKNKFDFYEIVRPVIFKDLPENLQGEEGLVLGMSLENDGGWSYAVMIPASGGDVWCLWESHLESAGRVLKREDVY